MSVKPGFKQLDLCEALTRLYPFLAGNFYANSIEIFYDYSADPTFRVVHILQM